MNKFYRLMMGVAILTPMVAAANTATFSYSDLTQEPAVWGFKTAEPYEVAIRLNRPELVGNKVTGFSVPMFASDKITDISVWLSKELTLEAKVTVPDIVQVPAEIEGDYIRVTFPEPYTITDEGVYVGYSFTVNEAVDQATKSPIALTYGKNPDGFYLHTKRSQEKWIDKSSSLGGLSMISVELDGDFKPFGARLRYPEELNVSASESSFTVPMTFVNYGTEPIRDFTLTYQCGGVSKDYTYTFPSERNIQILLPFEFEMTFDQQLQPGMNYPVIQLTKINGETNPMVGRDPGEMAVYAFDPTAMPRKRPLVEEYTGLWCGWCPRGFVALEKMNNLYPENFIGVAIHCSDAMAVIPSKQYPSEASGLPTAWMDRVQKFDPDFSVMKFYYDDFLSKFTYVNVAATAEKSEDGDSVEVKTEVDFLRPVVDEYRVFYMLVGDGLYDAKWRQTNYFSGKSVDLYPGMEQFINAEEKVDGLEFDDVLLLASDTFGVEDSLSAPYDIEPGVKMNHSYIFNLNDIESMEDDTIDLRAKAKTMKVVVGVVNYNTGEVLNATVAEFEGSGVEETINPSEVVCREYFDVAGRRVSASAKGLVIVRERLSDGSYRSEKRMF